jgi:release factor glutamine methyltransferase
MPVAVRDMVILRDLVARAAGVLDAAGIADAHLDARLLVCAAAQASHTELVAGGERAVTVAAHERAQDYVARRIAGEPVSRILQRREFWSLEFEVSQNTLDPRPDSETLVAAVLELSDLFGWRGGRLRICDLGTGSGCLLVALLSELPTASGLGVDICGEALATARRNATAHKLDARAEFVEGDWVEGLAGRYDIIVSNPPYVRSRDIATLETEVRDHDPRIALDGGADGLDAYRRIVRGARGLLATDGWLVLETGEGQAAEVLQMMADAGYGTDHAARPVVRDLGGRERCVRAIAG